MNNLMANSRKRASMAMMGMYLMAMNSVVAYAGTWDNAENTIKTILTDLGTALKNIVTPIATVALIFCFIMMLLSQSQKKVETYRSWCITIFICIVAIWAVNPIIELAKTVGSAFAGGGTAGG